MEFHRLDLTDRGIESFDGLSRRSEDNFLLINLQYNKLTTFEFFGTHPYLSELHLQHNAIHSFRALTKQPALRMLNLHGCPIAAHPYYRLMALLTVGQGIDVIDGLPVTSQERHVARSLGRHAALAVSYGWLLDLRPRTVEDYAAVISDHKRLRKDELRQRHGQPCVTVDTALTALSSVQEARQTDSVAATQLEEKQKTITRLARRVALLEGQLAEASEGHEIPMLAPNQLEAAGAAAASATGNGLTTSGGLFSAAELAQVDSVRFSRGIQLRHNLSAAAHSELQRVCVQLDHTNFTAETFLRREKLVQLPLRALRVRHLRPLTLVLEDEHGGALALLFESLPLLHTVYKALFVLSARPVPPLSALTQQQLREMAQTARRAPPSTTAAAITFDDKAAPPPSRPPQSDGSPDVRVGESEDEAAASSSGDAALPRPVEDDLASPAAAAASAGTGEEEGVEAEGGLDNVEDVPPLPAAFSRLSTGGGAESIVFALEESRRDAAGGAAATTAEAKVAASSAVLRSESNIDFHSAGASMVQGDSGNGVTQAGGAAPSLTSASPPGATATAAAPAKKGGLFANLMVNSSTSSDSIVFHSNENMSDKEDSVMLSEVNNREGAAVVPPTPKSAATAPSLPPSKAPLVPRASAGPAPPRPPPRTNAAPTPLASLPASAVRPSAAAATAAPPAVPARPPSARSLDKTSLNSSMLRGSKSGRDAGESSIAFQVADAPGAAVGEAARSGGGEAVRPRVPSRFGALQIDSDSD